MIYFTFKGRDSRDFGITVGRRPLRENANMRLDVEETAGLDGAFFTELGYNTYVMDIMFYVEGKNNLEKVEGWLQGKGKFTRSDLPGKYIEVERQSPIISTYITEELYKVSTTFYVINPSWKEVSIRWERPVKISPETYVIENKGNLPSRPEIKIYKNKVSKNDIIVNGIRFIYTFGEGDREVEIDCREQTVKEGIYRKERNLLIGYEFPKLNPGTNEIKFLEGDATIEFRRVSEWR